MLAMLTKTDIEMRFNEQSEEYWREIIVCNDYYKIMCGQNWCRRRIQNEISGKVEMDWIFTSFI